MTYNNTWALDGRVLFLPLSHEYQRHRVNFASNSLNNRNSKSNKTFPIIYFLPVVQTVYEDYQYSQTIFTGYLIVKRAVIGSKGGWKLSTIFLSCKVFHDWSIIKLGNMLYLLEGYIFAVLFETPHCFC